MSRGILIAGGESALLSAIEIEASRRVEHYAFAMIPNRLTGGELRSWQTSTADSGKQAQSGLQPQRDNALSGPPIVIPSVYALLEKTRIPLAWNPGSPISAHILVLAAENRFERIDQAILVCDPPSTGHAAADLHFADIEMLVNDHIKGWFFLVKELVSVFKAQEGGTLALVYPETGKDDSNDLLSSAALGAFRSLARSLLAAATSEPYLTLGFSGSESGDEAGFASFIFKQLEDGSRRSNGKIHKYGKLGFFK